MIIRGEKYMATHRGIMQVACQQVARHTGGECRSSGERRRFRGEGMLIRRLRRPWIAEF
jgi:hypothetical protein